MERGKARLSRRFSLCAVMQAITNCGSISRASLARQTGLSKQTISAIVQQLVEDGWVTRTGRTKGPVGRSASTYEVVPGAAHIASVDLGGTKVRVSIANLACSIVAERKEATDPRGGVAVVEQIARMCRAAASDGGGISPRLAVIGVPGVPDQSTGMIKSSPNVAGLDKIDMAAELEARLGLAVIVENDINLAVLGEQWVGHGADVDDMALVYVGTGIGAGLVINGSLVRGSSGAAGELGYLPLGADPFDPASQDTGALECHTATHGISSRYRALTGKDLTVPDIFGRAGSGEKDAAQVLDDTAQTLAQALASICAVTDPAVVVMGGSIGQRAELVDMTSAHLRKCFPRPVEVIPSDLGTRAPLVGGVLVALTRLHSMLFAEDLAGVEITLPQPRLQAAGGS